MRKIELDAFRVAGTFFRVAGEMRRLLDYFDNPGNYELQCIFCFIFGFNFYSWWLDEEEVFLPQMSFANFSQVLPFSEIINPPVFAICLHSIKRNSPR